MGQKGSKQNLTSVQNYNFQLYGLSPEESANIRKFYNMSANRQHELIQNDFKQVYLLLNPEAPAPKVKDITKKAFAAAGASHINFDEFLAVYIIYKSTSNDITKNMKLFLNQVNNKSFISQEQAQRYAKFIHNYHGGPMLHRLQ